MQNFNEQQLNLIKNSGIVFATWETYKEVFKYLYANGGFGFQSELFGKLRMNLRNDIFQAGCFPFQEGLFVYIPNNGAAFVRSIDIQAQEEWQGYYYDGNLLLTFDKKTFDGFSEIQDSLVATKPTLFERMKKLFKK